MSSIKDKADVLQKSLNALPKPLDIINLIDGSGSVSDEQFATMKFCMRILTTIFEFPNPPNHLVRMGAVQFDSQATIICNFTSDSVAFNTAVVAMPQKRGGTNAGAGFQTCLNLFKVDPRPASKAVILFTDGDVRAAAAVVPQLVQQGIKVFSFGVGLPKAAEPAVVSLSENAVFVQNFSEMQQIISQLSVLPSAPPKINIRTRSGKKASFDIIYSEPFSTVEIKLLTAGSNQWKTLPIADSNVYYLAGLTHDTEYKVTARVGTVAGAWTKECAPEGFRTLKENSETAILKSLHLLDVDNELIKTINGFQIPPEWQDLNITHLNIVLLGNVGNGKSAYFNSIYSTLLGQYAEVQMHKVSTQTVTLTINKKFLTNKFIRLWDTYGWTSANNSYEREFQFLLEGAIADGYKEGEEVLSKLILQPQIVDKAHAIIVVYEMPAVMTESNMNALKRFYNKMCDKHLQPLVILTKVDLITEADLDGRLSDVYDSGVIDVYISEFCKASTIPRSNVFPVVNFRGAWQQRDYVAEKLILNAFHAALAFAQTKVNNLLEQKVVIHDKSDPSKPTKVAVVDVGNVDADVGKLMDKIVKEPGLEQFQICLRSSSTVVQKDKYVTTKFTECATSSKHGFWEVYGLSNAPNQSPSAAASPKKQPSETDDNLREIAIFTSDPMNPANRSIGSVEISPGARLAKLRSLILDEVELPPELAQFQFFHLGEGVSAKKQPLVSEVEEGSVNIDSVMVLAKSLCVQISKAQAIEIGIMLEGSKRVGYIESVPLNTTLDVAKFHISEQTEVDFEFRFLTTSGNNVSINQEKLRTLQSVLKEGEQGELFFMIRKI